MTKHKYPNNLTYEDNDLITLEYFGDGSAGLDTDKIKQNFKRCVTTHLETNNTQGEDQDIYGTKTFKSYVVASDIVRVVSGKPYLSTNRLDYYVDSSKPIYGYILKSNEVSLWRDISEFEAPTKTFGADVQSNGLSLFFQKEEYAASTVSGQLIIDNKKITKDSESNYCCGLSDPLGYGLKMRCHSYFTPLTNGISKLTVYFTELSGGGLISLSVLGYKVTEYDINKALKKSLDFYKGTSYHLISTKKPLTSTITFAELNIVLSHFGKKISDDLTLINEGDERSKFSDVSDYKTQESAKEIYDMLVNNLNNITEVFEGANIENNYYCKCLYAFTREILGTYLSTHNSSLHLSEDFLYPAEDLSLSLGKEYRNFNNIYTKRINDLLSYEGKFYCLFRYSDLEERIILHADMEPEYLYDRGLIAFAPTYSNTKRTYGLDLLIFYNRIKHLLTPEEQKENYCLRVEYDYSGIFEGANIYSGDRNTKVLIIPLFLDDNLLGDENVHIFNASSNNFYDLTLFNERDSSKVPYNIQGSIRLTFIKFTNRIQM